MKVGILVSEDMRRIISSIALIKCCPEEIQLLNILTCVL